MDRNVLILYLRDLRDLEIAKRKILLIYNNEKNIYTRKIRELKNKRLINVPKRKSGWTFERRGLMICCIFISVMMGFVGYVCPLIPKLAEEMGEKEIVLVNRVRILFFIVDLFIICIACLVIKDANENNKEIEKAKKHNKDELFRVHNNETKCLQFEQQWQEMDLKLKNELKKVEELLKKNYSLNILANQYRNLESLYYIYDYMSSSQETLKDTLIHEHMENGIQRILEKLDYIIQQNEEIIFQNRILESQNRSAIEKNVNMLKELKQIEQNTNIAIQYAEISANYNEANAYFSLASYLRG